MRTFPKSEDSGPVVYKENARSAKYNRRDFALPAVLPRTLERCCCSMMGELTICHWLLYSWAPPQ